MKHWSYIHIQDIVNNFLLFYNIYNPLFTLHDLLKDSVAGDDEDEGTSDQPASKKLKVEPEKKKEKRQKVDEDEIQKMQ